jgi:hypothetical protein
VRASRNLNLPPEHINVLLLFQPDGSVIGIRPWTYILYLVYMWHQSMFFSKEHLKILIVAHHKLIGTLPDLPKLDTTR